MTIIGSSAVRGGPPAAPRSPRPFDAVLARIERHNAVSGGSTLVPEEIRSELRLLGFRLPDRLLGRRAHALVMALQGDEDDDG